VNAVTVVPVKKHAKTILGNLVNVKQRKYVKMLLAPVMVNALLKMKNLLVYVMKDITMKT
jgi:hypothetical protein